MGSEMCIRDSFESRGELRFAREPLGRSDGAFGDLLGGLADIDDELGVFRHVAQAASARPEVGADFQCRDGGHARRVAMADRLGNDLTGRVGQPFTASLAFSCAVAWAASETV